MNKDPLEILEYHLLANAFIQVVLSDHEADRLAAKEKVRKAAMDAESDVERFLSDPTDSNYEIYKAELQVMVKATFMVFASAAEALAKGDEDLMHHIKTQRQTCTILNM